MNRFAETQLNDGSRGQFHSVVIVDGETLFPHGILRAELSLVLELPYWLVVRRMRNKLADDASGARAGSSIVDRLFLRDAFDGCRGLGAENVILS